MRENWRGRILFFSGVFCIMLVLPACYYSISPGVRSGNIRNLVIPLFENNTVEAGIQDPLTDAVIERFLANGQYRLVDVPQADAAILGTITDIQEESLTFSEGTTAREVRLWIEVKVRLEAVANQKVIWEENQLRTFGDYSIAAGSDSERDPAIEIAIEKMAEEILNQSISGW